MNQVERIPPCDKDGLKATSQTPRIRYWDILPGSHLYLPTAGEGNRERLAEQFRQSWQAIPPDSRTTINSRWLAETPALLWAPVIELLPNYQWPGGCELFGRVLNFNAGVVDIMPDVILRSLIAHELSHVWHYATPSTAANRVGASNDEKDEEADLLAETWGFDMKSPRTWANEHQRDIVKQTKNPNVGW